MTNYQERFTTELFENSESNDYKTASNEWRMDNFSIGFSNCICGKHIEQVYTLKNIINDNMINVGSKCIKKFLNDNSSVVETCKTYIFNEYSKKTGRLKLRCVTCSNVYNIVDESYLYTVSKCMNCKTKARRIIPEPIEHVEYIERPKKKENIITCWMCDEPITNRLYNPYQTTCNTCWLKKGREWETTQNSLS